LVQEEEDIAIKAIDHGDDDDSAIDIYIVG
jgi:hypothetical protein